MNDLTLITLKAVRDQAETMYLQKIEVLANAIEEEREDLARFLEDHPEMEEFLTGDIVNGYRYVPGRPIPEPAPANGVGLCVPSFGSSEGVEVLDGP